MSMTPNQVAEFCLTLPGTRESFKWGNNRVFSIADEKMFAMLSAPAKGVAGLAFKVDGDLFLGYTDRPGIRPAPYLARARWIAMDLPYPLGEAELKAALTRAHQLVALRLPKYQQPEFLVPES